MFEILIVEDDSVKSEAVLSVLKENGVYGSSVTVVNNVRDALISLTEKSYNLLVLDLNLPIRADTLSQPKKDSGITILSKLGNEEYNTPEAIIGLTSFSELKENYESKFNELAFKIFLFDSADWRLAIRNKVEWLKKSLRQREKLNNRLRSKTVTLLVHGVMTTGEWQNKLKNKLENSGHLVLSYEYKFYSALKIVIGLSRKKQTEHFSHWLERQFLDNPNSKINIVAHSFGTYLALKSLELLKLDNLSRIDNIVLLGSVMPRNYNFDNIEKKFMPTRIINECGTRDVPLLASKAFCFGLGNAGRVGFNSCSDRLTNRYYEAGHSIFDEIPNYYELYWDDFVRNGSLSNVPRMKGTRFSEIKESLLDTLSPVPMILLIIVLLVYKCYG